MNSYWVIFEPPGVGSWCVDAPTEEEAVRKAENFAGVPVERCGILPYPAQPRLDPWRDDDGQIMIPSFCHDPSNCMGHTSCPKRWSCTE